MAVKELTIHIVPLKVLVWGELPAVKLQQNRFHHLDFAQYLEEGLVTVEYHVEFNESSDGTGSTPTEVMGAINGTTASFFVPTVSTETNFYYRLTAQQIAFNRDTPIYYSAWTSIRLEPPRLAWVFGGKAWVFGGKAWVFRPQNA